MKVIVITLFAIIALGISASAQADTVAQTAGCVSGNCINGKGKYVYADGDIYEGDWVNKKRQGHGTFTFKEGGIYTGQYANDLRNGFGKLVWRTGDIYEGNWVDSKMSGQGTYTFATGDTYTGQFANNLRNGKGKYSSASGNVYEGDWVNGKREGQGTLTFKTGEVYVGEWKNSQREGYGKQYNKSTGTVRAGTWKNDQFVVSTTATPEMKRPLEAVTKTQQGVSASSTTRSVGTRDADELELKNNLIILDGQISDLIDRILTKSQALKSRVQAIRNPYDRKQASRADADEILRLISYVRKKSYSIIDQTSLYLKKYENEKDTPPSRIADAKAKIADAYKVISKMDELKREYDEVVK